MLGEPHIRFYAGAALTVDDMKVGSLCIIDRVPHIGFTEKERMNMLDLGAAISNLIRERRDSFLRSNKDCAKLMNDMVENVRIPLISIASSTESLLVDATDRKKLLKSQKSNRGRNSIPDVETELDDKTMEKMSSLHVAVGQLKVIVESSICLGDFVVEKAESEEKLWASFTSSNIFHIIEDSRKTLKHLDPMANISWEIDTSQLSKGTRHVCSPKAISFVLLNSVQQLSAWWATIKVRVSFRDTGDAEYDCIVQQLDEAPICDIESTWQQGLIVMEFVLSQKRETAVPEESGVNMKPKGLLSFYSLQQVLKDVEGEFTHLDEGSSYEQTMSVTIPCAIIITEKEKEFGISNFGNREDSEQKAPFPSSVEKPLTKGAPRKAPAEDPFHHSRNDSCQMSPTQMDLDLSVDELDMQPRVTEGRRKDSIVTAPAPNIPAPYAMFDSVAKFDKGYEGESLALLARIMYFYEEKCIYILTTTYISALISIRSQHPISENSTGNIKLTTLRVLLVEDTVSQQKLMGKWLNGQGCEVTFAINGKIGLELLKTRQFDICLMDFLMVSSSLSSLL